MSPRQPIHVEHAPDDLPTSRALVQPVGPHPWHVAHASGRRSARATHEIWGDADVRRSRPMRARHVGRSPPILSWDLAYVWCDCASWPHGVRGGFFQPGKWPNCHRRTTKRNVCAPGGCRRRSSTRPSGPRGRPDDTCGRPGGCGGPGRSRTRASVAPGRVTTKEPDAAHAQRATSSCAASGSPPGTSRIANVTARARPRTMSAGRGRACPAAPFSRAEHD